jgi:hypothetical protein
VTLMAEFRISASGFPCGVNLAQGLYPRTRQEASTARYVWLWRFTDVTDQLNSTQTNGLVFINRRT